MVFLLAVLLVACGDAGVADVERPVGEPELPDLAPLPSTELRTFPNPEGDWEIRFTSIVVNVGDGDFTLRANRDTGDWAVDQEIHHTVQGAVLEPTNAPLVWGGDGHGHWHVSRFVTYRLASIDDQGNVTDEGFDRVDAKVGFCFYDFSQQYEYGPGDAVYLVEGCGEQDDTALRMGLSRGWGDTYVFALPGQSINIQNVADGMYRLIAQADEYAWFTELTVENNLTWVDLELGTRADGARTAVLVDVGPTP